MHIPGSQTFFASQPSQGGLQGLTPSLLSSHSGQLAFPGLEPLPSEDPVLTHTSWLDFVQPLSQPPFDNDPSNLSDHLSSAVQDHSSNGNVRRKLELGPEAHIPFIAKVGEESGVNVHQSHQGVALSSGDPNSPHVFEDKSNNNLQLVSHQDLGKGLPTHPVENTCVKNPTVGGPSEGNLTVENGPQKPLRPITVNSGCEKARADLAWSSSNITTAHVSDTTGAQKSKFVRGIAIAPAEEQNSEQEGLEMASGIVEVMAKTTKVETTVEATVASPGSKTSPHDGQASNDAGSNNTGRKHKSVQQTISKDRKQNPRRTSTTKTKLNQKHSNSVEVSTPKRKRNSTAVIKSTDDAADSSGGQSSGARKRRKRRMSEVLRLQKSLATASWTDSVAVEKQTTEIPISDEIDE